ncbi:hypothetical protein BOA8489_02789 [Boseongicola aestuarii]|uniref:Uncharacterized protein n=1 Tax=Boseongicola aestuarii TaxID=1470561 RepID=A0A238J350_9RHOB|nr:hypothetical protein BOA8489_02789 [Boseongicola aestuarii]
MGKDCLFKCATRRRATAGQASTAHHGADNFIQIVFLFGLNIQFSAGWFRSPSEILCLHHTKNVIPAIDADNLASGKRSMI